MKKKLLLLPLLAATFFTHSQNVGIGVTTPNAKLSISADGTELAGTAMSSILRTKAGGLGTVGGDELSLASIGFMAGINHTSLGIRALRSSTGIDWTSTTLLIGYDVDNTVRASSGFLALSANGNIGIGTSTPFFPLTFNNNLGEKISLHGTAINNYGIGIQSGLLQIHTDVSTADISFGYGSSSTFTERMRIKNAGEYGMELNGRLLLRNGTIPVDPDFSPGIRLYKADNSSVLAFMGTQNNQNIGFYGGPAGWGFVYDAINSRVSIGNSNPAYQFDISNRMRIRSGGNNSASAGLWLNNNANTEAAFIGMEDDTHVGLYGTGTGWKFGMNTSNGNIKLMGLVGIGTSAPAASLEVNGYTKLGSDAPSIKVKKLTVTTAATGGGYVTIPHGLDHSKILSFALMVRTTTGFIDYYEPNVPGLGVNFYWYSTDTGFITIGIISGDSGRIQSAPIKILITYEE